MFASLFRAILPALALFPALAAPALAGSPSPEAPIASEWRNPGNSVHVRLDKCGRAICGTITWASPKAIADAKRGGTTQLIGTHLFRDLKPAGAGKWSGKVFVPDIRQTFSGTIQFQGETRMVGKGCVLFGLVCKSQTWSRLG